MSFRYTINGYILKYHPNIRKNRLAAFSNTILKNIVSQSFTCFDYLLMYLQTQYKMIKKYCQRHDLIYYLILQDGINLNSIFYLLEVCFDQEIDETRNVR